jgi:hypothetical protein
MKFTAALRLLATGTFVLAALAAGPDAQAKGKSKGKTPAPAPAPAPAAAEDAPFDKEAAVNALGGVDLTRCKVSGGPRGEGHVLITFAPTGVTSQVALDRGPFGKTPVERCIVGQYKGVKIPKFSGNAITVGKTFRIE